MRPKYEYEIHAMRNFARSWMNEQGSEGWDLVAVVPDGLGYLLIFKRPSKE
jgi:hypothetical protein